MRRTVSLTTNIGYDFFFLFLTRAKNANQLFVILEKQIRISIESVDPISVF
jgi:hypothetical protein